MAVLLTCYMRLLVNVNDRNSNARNE